MEHNALKKKKTGWELIDLKGSLENEHKGYISKLSDYTKIYQLSAINAAKDKFVIIRQFASRELDGKIDMLMAPSGVGGDHYPVNQFGMSLVFVTDVGVDMCHLILPNTLEYESVSLDEDRISINYSNGSTTTNFQQIKELRSEGSQSKKDILERFVSINVGETPHL